MLLYKFPLVYEHLFKFPPFLIWRKKAINIIKEELKYFDIKPKKILDVGCGTGILIPSLRELYPKSEILGVDISASMIDIATKKYVKFAKFKNLDFFDFNEKQDLIIVFHSFTFFPFIKVIEKIKILLNPGGVCVIVTNRKALFSMLHQFILSKFFKIHLELKSPRDFYNLFSETRWFLHSRIISQFEGSFILLVKNKI